MADQFHFRVCASRCADGRADAARHPPDFIDADDEVQRYGVERDAHPPRAKCNAHLAIPYSLFPIPWIAGADGLKYRYTSAPMRAMSRLAGLSVA